MISLVVALVVAGVASSTYMMAFAQNQEVNSAVNQLRTLYVAESGVHESMMRLGPAVVNGDTLPTVAGTVDAPVAIKSGRFWCDIADNGNKTYTITATGRVNLVQRSIEAVVNEVGGGVFDYAIFAGNGSDDPNYTLPLGGVGVQADEVDGDIYSGGDILITGDATVSGSIDSGGTITGGAGTEDVSRPLPDIVGMHYETNHDFDVATLFASATYLADDTGGSAWQMPEDSPAHIFRMNPSDRVDETSGTPKDDYFLEDPYEPLDGFTAPNGKKGQKISLSGIDGKPGPSGTDKVYFIDGNLWIHNKPWGRMQLYNPAPEGAKVTFVVKGNVYFSDDVYIDDPSKSGVAFLAISDPAEPDSGNVYMGDPRYGTLEYLQSFVYAENNFYDNNLDAQGSLTVTIDGNMTAGNQVQINRDYVDGNGNVEHSKLTVHYDDRISSGNLTLPGLPKTDEGVAGLRLLAWHELPR